MGVILYLMSYGKLPFGHIKNQYKMLHGICDPLRREIQFAHLDDKRLHDCINVAFLNKNLKNKAGIFIQIKF
jgi:hypothetical protein